MKQIDKIRPILLRVRRFFTKRRVAVIGGLLLAGLIAVPVVTYANYAHDIADRERLMNRNSTGIILRDKNGEVFYDYGRLNGEDAKLSEVSDIFEQAVIASEDKEFRDHEGYSTRGMLAAMYANLLNKDATRYGGSTITQQLVKNKLLSSDKSYLRKYQELSMAIAIERRYSKDEILEMYINSVYFGEGAFGITDAAKTYFNKKPQDLSLTESSMLVGLLPAPSNYSPTTGDPEKAKQQQDRVLASMVETNAIKDEQRQEALAQQLTYSPAATELPKHAQHFATMVIDELKEKYGEETIIRSGYDVTTTLDLNWQRQAEANAIKKAQELGKAGARNAGVVAVDPKNGQIRVLVGSVDWNNPTFGKVNMATSARQPGSSFKPIYYTEAINKGLITPATIIEDKQKTWDTYAPTNYDFKYRGKIAVRNALAQSLNIPAVEVMQKLGVEEASQTAQRMGITTVNEPQKYGLSLALGTAEVKLTEMVSAYGSFANKGEQYQPAMVTTIKDKFDNEVFTYEQRGPKRTTSPEAAYLISSILSDQQARAPTFGNNLTLNNNRKAAVKTGTTNDSKDAWTIGYTPSLVVGVWMGNNENEAMVGLAGSSSAGGVWRDSMNNFLGNLPTEDFVKPDSVLKLHVCQGSGLKAASAGGNTYEEFFMKGTEPKEECNSQKEVKQEEKKREEEPKPEDRRDEPQEKTEEPAKTEEQPGERGSGNNNDEGGRGGGEDDQTTAPTEPTEPEPAPTEPATPVPASG